MIGTAADEKRTQRFIAVLRWASFFVFLGRGWQHVFWDAPYRAVLWDESLLSGTVRFLTGMTWDRYATDASVDHGIQLLVRSIGVFYFFCAAASLRLKKSHRFESSALLVGSVSLAFLAFLYCKEKSYQLGQFLEFSAQIAAPALLVYATRAKSERAIANVARVLHVAVAMTFASHGAYAIGAYAVPGDFVDMTMLILKVKDASALRVLELAGAMDFAVAGSLVNGFGLPVVLGYAALWGIGTSLARVLANVSWATASYDSLQWIPEVLFRLPHALLPMAGLCLLTKYSEGSAQEAASERLSRPSVT